MLYYMAKSLPIALEYHCFTNVKNWQNPFWDSESTAYYTNFFHKENAFRHVSFQTLDRDSVFLGGLVEW